MAVAPKYDVPSLVTVAGVRNNYFNRFDRDSRRYDAGSTLSVAVPRHWGEHLLRTGVQVCHTSYDGIDASLPVAVVRADGTPFQRIDFIGNPAVSASATDVAAFVEDQWSVDPRLTVHAGVRYAHDGIASGQARGAPHRRRRATVRERPHSRQGGHRPVLGHAAAERRRLPGPPGAPHHRVRRSGPTTPRRRAGHRARRSTGCAAPRSTTWNVELDQMLARNLLARVGYRNTHGSDQLVVDPLAEQGTLLLSSRGRSRSHDVRGDRAPPVRAGGHVTVSYVRSRRTRGNLNDFVSLFGDLRDPIIRRRRVFAAAVRRAQSIPGLGRR